MRKTRIVVPCYNEGQRLEPLAFLAALQEDPCLSFLFVNDGSRDDTLDILRSIKSESPARVDVMSLERNSGKAEAVRRGMLSAMDGRFENVGYWDADLATPLSAMREFCAVLENREVEAVFGSRVRLLGRKVERSALRHYVGRAFATCASLLLDMSVYDTQCGAKIFKNSPALKAVFTRPFKVGWIFDVEMLARFPLVMNASSAEVSARWVEIPLLEWIDVKGSKLNATDYVRAAVELGRLAFYLWTPGRRTYLRYLREVDRKVET